MILLTQLPTGWRPFHDVWICHRVDNSLSVELLCIGLPRHLLRFWIIFRWSLACPVPSIWSQTSKHGCHSHNCVSFMPHKLCHSWQVRYRAALVMVTACFQNMPWTSFHPHCCHSLQSSCVFFQYVLKRVSFGSEDCTKELKLECAYFLGQTS